MHTDLIKFFPKYSVAIAGGAALAWGMNTVAPAQAATYTLNFETDAAGNALSPSTQISDQWSDWGLELSASRNGNSRPLLLFDSNCFQDTCSGNDPDLATGEEFGTDPQGNVLIIQENMQFSDPDDDFRGGTVTFDFINGGINLDFISLLDMSDDTRASQTDVTFTVYSGDTIDEISYDLASMTDGVTRLSNTTEDNSLYQVDLGYSNVQQLDVSYPGSGAIASIQWDDEVSTDIPEPASVLGLLVAVGAGSTAVYRRRAENSLES